MRTQQFTPRQVRAARSLIGWSIQGLAAKAGVPPELVEALEAGHPVSPAVSRQVAAALFHRGGVRAIPETELAGPGVRVRWTAMKRQAVLQRRASR